MIRRVVLFCGLMVLFGSLGFLGLLPLFRVNTAWGLVLQALRIVLMVGAVIWFFAGMRRIRREVRELNGFVCWRCGYRLNGLAEAGTCPECGKAYALDELRRRWMLEPPN